ncbi:helix-turn-helix domain-containing protein [Mycobacterium sp. SMC-4]|uniref:helix-turn-helix domain-containing protein n=1 Tax=Mycobacterium sp. SMC-4 TaxID=2857059 RepID=UPI0021B43D5A|nr:helix-turn-helix domain-containing protein [Mycobacterium sp. SMC-4]UXA19498.1 helix-turn-helix domain-containing protein [Mycobacterium sp. SMC-4]
MSRRTSERTLMRRERIVELTRNGCSAREIASILGITRRTVVRVREATGTSQPVAGVPLTADQVRQAERLLDDGCSISEAARTIGCSYHTLHRRFPDRVWTREQCVEHAAMLMRWRHMFDRDSLPHNYRRVS